MSLVRLENVSKHYTLGEQQVQALKDVSLCIHDGEFLAIAGPSGSGKSTLLNLIGCIDTPSLGKIFINGTDVSGRTSDELSDLRARTIGFIFQTFNLFPVLSAEENVDPQIVTGGIIGRMTGNVVPGVQFGLARQGRGGSTGGRASGMPTRRASSRRATTPTCAFIWASSAAAFARGTRRSSARRSTTTTGMA